MTEEELRAYFLGQLDGETAARLEERLLEDDDLFAEAREVEDDLFDAFARGRLAPAEHEQFVARYGGQGGRLAFAQALARRTGMDAGRAVPGRNDPIDFPRLRQNVAAASRSAPRAWIPLAAAAVLLLTVGGLLVMRARGPRETPQPSQASAPRPASPVVAVALITLGTSRSAGEPLTVTLPAGASALRLRVRLDPADRFERYALVLRSAADQIVWHTENVHASSGNDGLALTADVPADALPNGPCELAVRGANAGAAPEALGFVTIDITHAR